VEGQSMKMQSVVEAVLAADHVKIYGRRRQRLGRWQEDGQERAARSLLISVWFHEGGTESTKRAWRCRRRRRRRRRRHSEQGETSCGISNVTLLQCLLNASVSAALSVIEGLATGHQGLFTIFTLLSSTSYSSDISRLQLFIINAPCELKPWKVEKI
jgi:hypothetical protein